MRHTRLQIQNESLCPGLSRVLEGTRANAMRILDNRRIRQVLPLAAAVLLLAASACRTRIPPPPPPGAGRVVVMETTGYCPCGKCCGWKRDWLGRPVYAYGPNKGKPKKVGVCADGTRARYGTVAADTRYYPFGTRMYIPGYGYGVVHDRGKAIQGPYRIDLFFPRHSDAVRWGRRRLRVIVFR